MPYLPHYARRPRLHHHSRYGGPSKEILEETTNNGPQSDKTRAPKMATGIFSVILIVGCIMHFIQQPSIEESMSILKESPAPLDPDEPEVLFSVFSSNATVPRVALHTPNFAYGRISLLPPELSSTFAGINDPIHETDVPLFWHIPRAGGSTMKDITALCLMLTQASEVGVVDGHDEDTELAVVEDIEGGKFMNADTTTIDGLYRAIDLGLGRDPRVNVIITPFVRDAAGLFDPFHRGRVFALFRHPVDRAVSMYYYIRPKGITVEEYARGGMVEDNWMTRFLTDTGTGELTLEHEAAAKEILRQKVLIGLLKYKAVSFERFERFFGWKVKGKKMEDCRDRTLVWDWSNKNKHPQLRPGSSVWKLLSVRNEFDIRLYEYAEELFVDQGNLFRNDQLPMRGDV